MKYAKLINDRVINRTPPRSAYIDGNLVTGELPADYLATLYFYPFFETEKPSDPPDEGKHWEQRFAHEDEEGYDTVVIKDSWIQVDDPAPSPRTFSKLRIVAALMQEGVWEQVKAFIEAQGLYDLFIAAQDFSEDNQDFNNGKMALQQLLGWDDEKVERILENAILM